MTSDPNSLYWMYTINNPSDNEVPSRWPDVVWTLWQREKGEQGTEHLQGYVIFKQKKRRSWVNRHCVAAHWEVRKGTHQQAYAYVTKEDTRIAGPYSVGEEPAGMGGQGKRNDLLSLKRALDEGKSEADVAEDETLFPVWAKYYKIIPRYKMLRAEHQRNWQTTVKVLWGPPGTGKSSRALAEAGPGAFWLGRPAGTVAWWDGYQGQEHVVIDEFYGWMSRDLVQRIIDRYPLNVETKGGSVPFVAKVVWITSNEPPERWWKVGLGAMQRRLTAPIGEVIHMDAPIVAGENAAHYAEFIPAQPLALLSPPPSPMATSQEAEAFFHSSLYSRLTAEQEELFGCEFE